jgi:hypothetical protein
MLAFLRRAATGCSLSCAERRPDVRFGVHRVAGRRTNLYIESPVGVNLRVSGRRSARDQKKRYDVRAIVKPWPAALMQVRPVVSEAHRMPLKTTIVP